MGYVKLYEDYINEAEFVNVILIPSTGDQYRIDIKKDAELGITSAMSDDQVSALLDKKYGEDKWFKRLNVDSTKVTDAKKQLDSAWKAKSSPSLTESYKIENIEGEWAIVGKISRLFGKKIELEKILKLLNESESVKEFKVVPVGVKNDQYFIKVNDNDYGYKLKADTDFTIDEIAEKFIKILKYSAGRALNWLKKNTELASGSKQNESLDYFIVDNLFESKDDIDDMAQDMFDFYGAELPDSYQECEEYAKRRDIKDIDLLKDIFMAAQMLQDEDEE